MKVKCLIIILMALVLVNIASATIEDCKRTVRPVDVPCMVITTWKPTGDCNTHDVKIYNSNATLIDTHTMGDYSNVRCNITFNHTTTDSYLLNFSSGDSARIIVEGEDDMTSLSVTLFFGAITLALFWLGFNKMQFTKNIFANMIFKRLCFFFGLLTLSFNTTIIVTMADNAGLGITQEIFRYLWIFNWSIYLWMIYIFYTTVIGSVALLNKIARAKRMGKFGDNDGEEN